MKRFQLVLMSLIAQGAMAAETIKATRSEVEEKSAANVVSLEALGRAGLYSVNYDRSVTKDISVGVGFSYFSASTGGVSSDLSSISTIKVSAVIIPIYGNYYFTQSNHRLFGTAGVDVSFGSVSGGTKDDVDFMFEGTGVAGVVGGGYEYRPDGGGFVFRAAPYLLVGASGVNPWLGLSFGAAF